MVRMVDKTATLSEEEWALILEPLDFDAVLEDAPKGFYEAVEKLRAQLGTLPDVPYTPGGSEEEDLDPATREEP